MNETRRVRTLITVTFTLLWISNSIVKHQTPPPHFLPIKIAIIRNCISHVIINENDSQKFAWSWFFQVGKLFWYKIYNLQLGTQFFYNVLNWYSLIIYCVWLSAISHEFFLQRNWISKQKIILFLNVAEEYLLSPVF